jgi:hypothetical protein
VKDDPDGMPHARADATDAVADVHAVVALRAAHWSVVDGEGDRITLPKRYDLRTTLHPWPLFGQDELASCEIRAWLREQNRDLDRECQIAIAILMEAVEITRDILQQ